MAAADPDLRCRMFESHVPDIGQTVMVEVNDIQDDGASVILLEFNDLKGRIDEPCRDMVGRFQAVDVINVDESNDSVSIILSSPTRVSQESKYTLEREYNRREFVQLIFREAAKTLAKDLKRVYKGSNWCSYDQLLSLRHPGKSKFKKSLEPDLKAALIAKLQLISNDSWRLRDPFILTLGPVVLPTGVFLCWAFALTRQFEAKLKSKGRLGKLEHLSVQDLVNKTREMVGLRADGDIADVERARAALSFGIATENGNEAPIKYYVKQKVNWHPEGPLYSVRSMEVYRDTDPVNTPEKWNKRLGKASRASPYAASVLWFRSYANNREGKEVFKPTEEEWALYLRNPSSSDLPVHVMLLTGCLTDENGNQLLEFQENGDLSYGRRGFLYFERRIPSLVFEFVKIKVQ